VRKQENSGLTVREFCRENDLPESAFYYWRRELLRRDAQRGEQEQERGERPSAPMAFVPVTLTEETRPDAARIEIELSGGRRVHVTAPVDRRALADVLLAVSDAERAVLEAERPEGQAC